jgi:hypothetical protein
VLLLLEGVDFLDKLEANHVQSPDDVLVEELDGGLVFLWLRITEDTVVYQSDEDEDHSEGEQREK